MIAADTPEISRARLKKSMENERLKAAETAEITDMLLDLPCDIIRSMARFRLCAHTLQIEIVTWTHNTSLTCDLCKAHDVQDEQHALFHCTHPHVVSLRRTYASLSSSAGFNNVSAFLGQENNKLYFFLHALIVFYEQASSRTSGLKAFLVTLVTLVIRQGLEMSDGG